MRFSDDDEDEFNFLYNVRVLQSLLGAAMIDVGGCMAAVSCRVEFTVLFRCVVSIVLDRVSPFTSTACFPLLRAQLDQIQLGPLLGSSPGGDVYRAILHHPRRDAQV